MTIGRAFGILRIPPTDNQKSIQHAFALRSREAHPEENPEGWRELAQAYQICMTYAKNRSKTQVVPEPVPNAGSGPEPEPKTNTEPGPESEPKTNTEPGLEPELETNTEPGLEPGTEVNTDYYDVFREMDQKQEKNEKIEKELSTVLDQLEKEKVIKDLNGYSHALELFSRLSPFASDDLLPYRVCSIFSSTMKKRKHLLLFRRKMLRLLSAYSDILNQADEVIIRQQSEGMITTRHHQESFAGLRMSLSTITIPILVWWFLVFVWVVRYFLTPLFAIATPTVSQVPDGTVHYVTYREGLPGGTYVRVSLREAHWTGIGYYMTSDTIRSGNMKMTKRTCHQYVFLKAVTTDGENVLIPMEGTFSEQPVFPRQEVIDYFRSCSELKKEINQSGDYMLQGKIQEMDFPDTLEPGIPVYIIPGLYEMDEEMKELLPEGQGRLFFEDRTDHAPAEQPGVISEDRTDNTPAEQPGPVSEDQTSKEGRKGLFILEDPPEEGTPLYREEKLYFFQDPVRFIREVDRIENLLFYTLQGAALLALLIALKKRLIPHVRLE